jgi:hypothetical protein
MDKGTSDTIRTLPFVMIRSTNLGFIEHMSRCMAEFVFTVSVPAFLSISIVRQFVSVSKEGGSSSSSSFY